MEHRLKTPLSKEDVTSLRAGDLVWITGTIYTARDEVHAHHRSCGNLPIDLEGAVLYHCGPLIKDGLVISAGPTTSSRVARYTKDVVDRGVRAMIGKGGISEAVEDLRGKAVYLAYPGGCGALAAKTLQVKGIHLEDLGMAEALWELEANDFGPMIVAIDSFGKDLYEVAKRSSKKAKGNAIG